MNYVLKPIFQAFDRINVAKLVVKKKNNLFFHAKKIWFQAGIPTNQLCLALEPEAASLFCRHLPVEKVKDADGQSALSSLAPGKRYLVLDAGGKSVK